MSVDHDTVKAHLTALYDELVQHEGFAELAVDIRILKRGQKEVVIRSGRQHRYVVDQAPAGTDVAQDALPGSRHGRTGPT